MFSIDIDFIIARQRYNDMLREVEHQRLIRAARAQQANTGGGPRKVVHWVGSQIVRWGSKLQGYGPTPLTDWPQIVSPSITSAEYPQD